MAAPARCSLTVTRTQVDQSTFFKEFDLEEWMCTLTVWALQLVNAKDEQEGESLGKFWSKAESKIPSSLLFS